MALSGLDIYKQLPKTNCKKYGFQTCLAFAMALAGKKTSLDKCPDVSEAAKQLLESASLPPMATIAADTEKLLEFLQKLNHPVLTMEPIDVNVITRVPIVIGVNSAKSLGLS